MTDTAQLSRSLVDNVLDAVRQSQEFTLNSLNNVTDTARKVNRELPTRNFTNPLAEYFPPAAEIVDTYFDFAERLLANQREFALNITKGLNATKVAGVVVVEEPKTPRTPRTATVPG